MAQGGAQLYADYWQWEQARALAPRPAAPRAAAPANSAPAAPPPARKKLSYLDAREWEGMEERILEAEQALEAIRAEMQSPEVVSDGPRLHACYLRMQEAEAAVEALYARWAELEAKQG